MILYAPVHEHTFLGTGDRETTTSELRYFLRSSLDGSNELRRSAAHEHADTMETFKQSYPRGLLVVTSLYPHDLTNDTPWPSLKPPSVDTPQRRHHARIFSTSSRSNIPMAPRLK